jgi:exopolysaccharide biosynthesis protein
MSGQSGEGYNLDGGGSSTFVYGNEVLNRPSDGKLRPVVTNIVFMP